MRNGLKGITLAVTFSVAAWNAGAVTIYTGTPTWGNGAPAADCYLTYPTVRPLSQQRTLLVDNNRSNGSVLFSWDYADFAPNFNTTCYQRTTYNGAVNVTSGPPALIISSTIRTAVYGSSSYSTYPTNIPGIGLRMYVKGISTGSVRTGIGAVGFYWNSASVSTISGGSTSPISEYLIATSYADKIQVDFNSVLTSTPPVYTSIFDAQGHFAVFSIRGELVKTGVIAQSQNFLKIPDEAIFSHTLTGGFTTGISTSEILGSNGIALAYPACRLRGSTNYQVGLGQWIDVAGRNSGSLPAYGAIKPIDINLECSGKTNNVKFSFQDASSGGLLNRNISVYDSGGQYIEGLEIEMSYNGSRIDVNTTVAPFPSFPVSIGSKGQVKANAEDLSYSSQDTAQFGARFVQRSAIKRNGVSYTGPVMGQVNMTVTYE